MQTLINYRLTLTASVLLALAANASATTYYVNANGTNPVVPYTSWATAATNIQDAMGYVPPGSTVLVTNGVYQYGGDPDYSTRVLVYPNITVRSVNGPAVTTIVGTTNDGDGNTLNCAHLDSGATLSGFTLTNGAATFGGGADCNDTSCLVTNCVIVGNVATWEGGGADSGTLINCVLTGNSAPNASAGAGGAAYGSTLINCLLAGNFAGYSGGATFSSTLVNCTVVSNSVGIDGSGGVINVGTVLNSIIYYNSSPIGIGFFTNCCAFPVPFGSWNGANNFTNPPLFANLPDGDYRLASSSPCINAGNNAFVTVTNDLDGNPRIAGGTVDIGAYEYQKPASVVSYAWLEQYGLPVNDSVDAADMDGTGFDVYQDWIAGLNPTNPASVLAVLPPAPAITNNARITVRWQSVSGISYNLLRSTNLAAQPAFSTIQTGISGQAGTTSYTDATATNHVSYFYRVSVQKQ